MENLERHLSTVLASHFDKYKEALVLLGPRQVGKTTILKKLFPNSSYLLVDDEKVKNVLESYSASSYKQALPPNCKYVIVDEIQLISNPGRALKIFYDELTHLKLIVTGSSSLRIKNKLSESMVGRKINYFMYPLTFSEYLYQSSVSSSLDFNIFESAKHLTFEKKARLIDVKSSLSNVLIYGLYPGVINYPRDEVYLKTLAEDYALRDVIELNVLEDVSKARSLLTLLAHQVGNLINYSELSTRTGLDSRTVKKYIKIFEDNFLVFLLYPYSTNKRDEIGKSPKVYFWDLGLRNAIISNFSPLEKRADLGHLFESFIIAEILKANTYLSDSLRVNYWRTTGGSEVDLVISTNESLFGFEIKFSKLISSGGKAFLNRYPKAKFRIINSENFY